MRCELCVNTNGFVVRSDGVAYRRRHDVPKTWHGSLERDDEQERAEQMALPGMQSAVLMNRVRARSTTL
jgi:hypothetical protein